MVPVSVRFELFVDDVGRSVAFYAAALGLRAPPGCDPQGYVSVRAGRCASDSTPVVDSTVHDIPAGDIVPSIVPDQHATPMGVPMGGFMFH